MKKERGITLIALVVTIIVLIILASISIATLTGDNGIINQAQDAKEQTEISEEKEIVSLASTRAAGEDRYGNVTKENLTKELNDLAGDGKTTVTGNGPFTITFTESERSYVVNADGQIFDEEEIADEMDKKALKFLVNSGDDGFVVLPISIKEWKEENFEIDWGDGTSGVDEEYISEISKVASLNNLKVSIGTYPYGTPHNYKEKNKEYVVTIKGICTEINSRFGEVSTDKIIELRQWGETGLEYVILEDCINLTKIANPERDTFNNIDFQNYSPFSFAGNISLKEIPSDLFKYCENIKAFTNTFADCTSLTEIPKDLFSNCSQVEDFSGTFAYCSGLEKIPENLFSNCTNVESFEGTFAECSNLTGNAIDLWQRVLKGEENNYIGIPNGNGCYHGCEKLVDYHEIPPYWSEGLK